LISDVKKRDRISIKVSVRVKEEAISHVIILFKRARLSLKLLSTAVDAVPNIPQLMSARKVGKQFLQSEEYLSRFRVSFILILLGVFLAFSSLGAGLIKRTRKPLGAHQGRF
jgi:hypothetical protein